MVARSYTRRGDSSEYLVAVLVYCANPYPRVAPIFEMLWANIVSGAEKGMYGPYARAATKIRASTVLTLSAERWECHCRDGEMKRMLTSEIRRTVTV